MKIRYLLIPFSVISLLIHADINEKINISSDVVEFIRSENSIAFKNNVEIRSEYINISATDATYNNKEDVIYVSGNPSLITSNKNDSFFNGKANKIIIFNDEKVHLIGDATMFYENINISSDKIVFNPQTGSLLSEK